MAESGQTSVGHAVGAWCWHARHAAPCRVVDRQDMWGETAYRVWLPTKDAVVRARPQDLAQLDSIQPGLMAAVLDRDRDGNLVRKAGVMAVVVEGGIVCAGDAIVASLPALPHRALQPV